MGTIIFGDGNLGHAIAAALVARGEPPPGILGRPANGRHRAPDLAATDLVFEASRAEAVVPNLAAALAAGCRHFVVATTGWDDSRPALEQTLRSHDAAAVAAPNFSLGVALFLRLVEAAGGLFAPLAEFDAYVVEWHRREKPDRPSGTAREIARRLLAVHPAKTHLADAGAGPPASDALEVVALRAGASPGMHLVGFDSPGETLELRLTARDRAAYAAGALAAADWLRAGRRPGGLHPFERVVDELLGVEAAAAAGPPTPGRPDAPLHRRAPEALARAIAG